MALADLLSELEGVKGETPATAETCQNVTPEDWALFNAWLFHFTDMDDLPVRFAPAVSHEKALSFYPAAVAAQPIPDQPRRKPTKPEADEITALVQAVYADDTDDDRAEALTVALADPDGALLCYRTIAKACSC